MAIEVEIKAKVENEEKILEKLKQLGAVFEGEETHIDQYYNHPCRNLTKSKTKELIRIRDLGKKAELGYHVVTGKNSAHEHEVICEDAKQLHEILKLLGCTLMITIKKKRKKYKLKWKSRDVEAVIDDVEKIGKFIETEIMVNEENQVEEANKLVKELMIEILGSEEDFIRLSKVERLWEFALKNINSFQK